jgi:hypothetical protein
MSGTHGALRELTSARLCSDLGGPVRLPDGAHPVKPVDAINGLPIQPNRDRPSRNTGTPAAPRP